MRTLRHAAVQGQIDDAESRLHLGVPVKLVEDDLRLGVALQLDHDPHAVAIGFIAQIGDAVDLLLPHQIGDANQKRGLIDLIRNLGDDDAFLAAFLFLDRGLGADVEPSAAGAVSLADAVAAVDDAAGREIGTGDKFHQLVVVDFGIIDDRRQGVDHLARLCGGILVAMPTAMPEVPLQIRLGNFPGRTLGSVRVSS